MDALQIAFTKVLDMSITAGIAALIVTVLRLALRRAPRSISVGLWCVVLLRMLLPVSFSLPISAADGFGSVEIPLAANGSAAYVRQFSQGSQPVSDVSAAVQGAAVNSISDIINTILIIAAVIWAAGTIATLVWGVVSYIRLRIRMRAAVKLEPGVYEADGIETPFVLGFIKPRIYLPIGMDQKDSAFALCHERAHIRAKDHILKPVAYLALCIHWFNPLAWLFFALLSKDMEERCDQRVLREIGQEAKPDYSRALLRLSAGRRVFAAGPLAFGEGNTASRIKSILSYKKPMLWISVAAIVIASGAGIFLLANPQKDIPTSAEELYGNYVFDNCLYMTPVSSLFAGDGYEEYYTFSPDSFTVTQASGERQTYPAQYEFRDFDEEAFREGYLEEVFPAPDVSQYLDRRQCVLSEAGSNSRGFSLYFMDGEIWLEQRGDKLVWSIYKIKSYGGELPESAENMTISGTEDGAEEFEAIYDYTSMYEDDECFDITPEDVKAAGYTVFKYSESCASFLLFEGEAYPMGEWFGGYGVTSMALADLNGDGKQELYFTFSWGSGLHRSMAGYFDPAEKQVTVFNFAYFNEDMLVKGGDTIALFSAQAQSINSFTDMELIAGGKVADIVLEDGEICFKPLDDRQPQTSQASSFMPPEGMPESAGIEVYTGGTLVHDLTVSDGVQLQTVMDAVQEHFLQSAAWEGATAGSPSDRIVIWLTYPDDSVSYEFAVFYSDGKPCIQDGGGRYTIISSDNYEALLALTFDGGTAEVKVTSGGNYVYAFGFEVKDGAKLTPQQAAPFLQYLDIENGNVDPVFIPYLNGKELFGRYRLYDMNFNEIQLIKASGSYPQGAVFLDADWPGTYIVELDTTIQTDEGEKQMQYFFGAVLPDL